MSERDELLAAILAEPADDTRRLVFADWLDEHGEPERAAFVRLQCEAAALSADDDVRGIILDRASRWRTANFANWHAELPQPEGIGWGRYRERPASGEYLAELLCGLAWDYGDWERGFPAEVWVNCWPAFERQADAVLAACPLTSLRVELPEDEVLAFARSPIVGRFRRIQIESTWYPCEISEAESMKLHPQASFGDAALTRLAANPALATVAELLLHQQPISAAGVAALAASPHAVGLRRLDLSKSHAVGGGVAALAGSPHLAGLEELNLERCGLRDADLSAFARSPYLKRLTTLHIPTATAIEENHFTSDGIAELGASRFLTGLRHLDLSGYRNLTPVQLQSLFDGPLAQQLYSLNLSGQTLGDSGAEGVARLRDLESAKLHGCGITSISVNALLAGLPKLRRLELSHNAVGDEGADTLAASPLLSRLKHLDLSSCGVSDAGVVALVNSPNVAGLEFLSLGDDPLSSVAIEALADSPHLAGLRVLWLWGVKVPESTVRSLAESPHLQRVKLIHLSGPLGSRSPEQWRRWLDQQAETVSSSDREPHEVTP